MKKFSFSRTLLMSFSGGLLGLLIFYCLGDLIAKVVGPSENPAGVPQRLPKQESDPHKVSIKSGEFVSYGLYTKGDHSWNAEVVDVLYLYSPSGEVLVSVEVTTPPTSGERTRVAFVSGGLELQKGDKVEVHWIYHNTPSGGRLIPFILPQGGKG